MLDFNKIQEMGIKEKKTLEQLGLKLSEETGEVNQALLSTVGASGCEYKKLDKEHVKEECVDTILVALSLFYKLGGTHEELKALSEIKTVKWQQKTGMVLEKD